MTQSAQTAEPRQRAMRRAQLGLALAGLLALAILARLLTQGTPPPTIVRVLPASVRLSGAAPVLQWPAEGQAAVEVVGLGSIATRGPLRPVPIASVAKVMTAYLELSEHPLAAGAQGPVVITVTRHDVAEQQSRVALGESTLSVQVGEQLTERQALQAMLLASANNVAALIAEHSAGGSAAFIARMNAAARSLGMRSTTYTDPSGFEAQTVSTASDQLLLARAAMSLPAFAGIVAEPGAVLPRVGLVHNLNALVGEDGYIGIKTGSDRAAGGCLLFAKFVEVAGERLMVLGAVLGQHGPALIAAALAAARRLGDSTASALALRTALAPGTTVLHVSGADGSSARAVTSRALSAVGWGGLALPVRVTQVPAGDVHAGQRLGSVHLAGGPTAAAVAVSGLAAPSLSWRLRHLL